MAVSITNLTSGSDTTNNPSTTASISPASGGVVLATVVAAWTGDATDRTLSISGCGLTWTEVGRRAHATRRTLFLMKGTGTPSSGTLSITAGQGVGTWTENMWVIDQVTGQDGTTPLGAFYSNDTSGDPGQSNTVEDVTISDTPAAGDYVYAALALETSQTVTLGSELSDAVGSSLGGTDSRAIHTAIDSSPDSTPFPSWTWSTSCGAAAFGIVVKAASGGSIAPLAMRHLANLMGA